jgi:hypothetical protein
VCICVCACVSCFLAETGAPLFVQRMELWFSVETLLRLNIHLAVPPYHTPLPTSLCPIFPCHHVCQQACAHNLSPLSKLPILGPALGVQSLCGSPVLAERLPGRPACWSNRQRRGRGWCKQLTGEGHIDHTSRLRLHTHICTHTHIYIYIYICAHILTSQSAHSKPMQTHSRTYRLTPSPTCMCQNAHTHTHTSTHIPF